MSILLGPGGIIIYSRWAAQFIAKMLRTRPGTYLIERLGFMWAVVRSEERGIGLAVIRDRPWP